MAMTKSTIEEVRSLSAELSNLVNNNADISLNSLGANAASFQEFLAKTEGGQDFLEKYQQLLELVKEYYAQAADINKTLEDFLAEQESLNS